MLDVSAYSSQLSSAVKAGARPPGGGIVHDRMCAAGQLDRAVRTKVHLSTCTIFRAHLDLEAPHPSLIPWFWLCAESLASAGTRPTDRDFIRYAIARLSDGKKHSAGRCGLEGCGLKQRAPTQPQTGHASTLAHLASCHPG